MPENEKAKGRKSNWLLWWRLDEAELSEQIAGYYALSVWKSARKLSALCLCLTIAITLAFVLSGIIAAEEVYLGLAFYAILVVFVYLGHRWAMIGAMLLWTADKAMIVVNGFGNAKPNAFLQVIWWAVYMHAFYLAFQTEQRRRALSKQTATA